MNRMTTLELSLFRSAGPLALTLLSRDFAETLHAVRQEKRAPGWFARLVTAIAAKRDRNRVVGQLSRLDDRMLRDIGFERTTLEEAVDAVIERRAPIWAEAGVVATLADLARKLAAPIARWRRAQVTLGELEQLDSHILTDIGVTRGDLILARSSLIKRFRTANENEQQQTRAA